jgi:thymidylate kinase
MSKGFLICFVGIDGSGKSTLSRAVVEILDQQGIKCRYVYGRMKPIILRPLIWLGRQVFLPGRDMLEDYSEYSTTKQKAMMRHSFLLKFYNQILWLDYMLQILFKVSLPLTLGKNIVCDRYIQDTVITDLSIDMNYSDRETAQYLHRALRFVPKPDINFLVDLPEEVAYLRKNDVPSINYLKVRRKTYLYIAREWKMTILDGTKTIEELRDILTLILINTKGVAS